MRLRIDDRGYFEGPRTRDDTENFSLLVSSNVALQNSNPDHRHRASGTLKMLGTIISRYLVISTYAR